jgi:hypothetical protein
VDTRQPSLRLGVSVSWRRSLLALDLHALAPFATAPNSPSDRAISSCADAGLHASKVFLTMHSCNFLHCAYQAPESLLLLPTSNIYLTRKTGRM